MARAWGLDPRAVDTMPARTYRLMIDQLAAEAEQRKTT